MDIKIKLSKFITNSPQIIQFAKDGKYEEAWVIKLSKKVPSKQEIENYIATDSFDELIVEYIWNPETDSERYVLTIVQDKGCAEQDKNAFFTKCLDLFYRNYSFGQLIDQIDSQIVGHPFLFQNPVQRVRLGVFNHWFSVGPIEMWNTGEKLDIETIVKKITERPEVEKSKLNYQGLAFIYNFDGSLPGPYHILKTPTCKKIGDEWVVDTKLVWDNMNRMLSFSQ